MVSNERLAEIVESLIEVLHLEAKEIEKLVTRVEQVAGRLPGENQFSLVVSELSELKRRIQGEIAR